MIRYYYRRVPIEPRVVADAVDMGLDELRTGARTRLSKVIGPPLAQTYRGGFTPWKGNLVYYAQHRTATCCRRCLEEWHGINRKTELSNRHLEYFTELILQYAQERVPPLIS